MQKIQKTYILAQKIDEDTYSGSDIDRSLARHFDGMEYGDVATKQFQIWEYPSGVIYDVIPDRFALDNDDYSSPDPDVWLPTLSKAGENIDWVSSEFNRLTSMPK